jgi:hypothetical protein
MVLFENRDYFINLDKLDNGEKTDKMNNSDSCSQQQKDKIKLKKNFLTIFKLRIVLTYLYGFLVSKAIGIILMIFLFYSFENLTSLGIFEKYLILAMIMASILISIWSFLSLWLPKVFKINFVVILINIASLVLLFLLNIYFINKINNLFANHIKLDKTLLSIMKFYYIMILISCLVFTLINILSFCFLGLYLKKYDDRNRLKLKITNV